MRLIVLDIYFNQQIDYISNHSWFTSFKNLSPIVFIIIILILSLYLFLYLVPLVLKSPKKAYKRYIKIREKLEIVENLYENKKITFEEYSFSQFNYAKEYELLVSYLSKYPNYKVLLKPYKLREIENRETKYDGAVGKKIEKEKIADFLYDLLLPHARYYSSREIEQAVIDEGYTKEIATLVVNKMHKNDVEFLSENRLEQNKIINLINYLFAKNKEIENSKENTIELNLENPKNTKIAEEKITVEKYPVKEEKEKIIPKKSIFRKKQKIPTISEIEDIFKEIDKRLKEES